MNRKEGLLWTSRRSGQLRYSVNNQDQFVQPLSVYTAGEDIKRGHLVSIALTKDIVELAITSDDNIVVKTRTDRHMKVAGIALENVAKGEKLHLQPVGRFSYGDAVAIDEYLPPFVNADRGKLCYASPIPGELTLDRTQAILQNRNLIQVGFISNTEAEYPLRGMLDIEIQFEGDGRGPVGSTEFEILMGEPYNHAFVNGKKPIKAFAYGATAERKFVGEIAIGRPDIALPESGGAWFAVYSAKAAHILVFNQSGIPQGTTDIDNDKLAVIQAAETTTTGLYSEATPPITWSADNDLFSTAELLYEDGSARLANSIKDAILEPIHFLGGEDLLTIKAVTSDLDTSGNQTDIQLTVECDSFGGDIQFAWDSSLDHIFGKTTVIKQGSYGNQGKAVLADRTDERSNVIGLLQQSIETEYEVDEPALFVRQGLFTANYDAFVPGQEYFLGTNGELTPFCGNLDWADKTVRIGTAQTATTLMVDIGAPTRLTHGGEPIGSIRPLKQGFNQPEYGFLLMDGSSVEKAKYPTLFKCLSEVYGPAINDADVNKFVVPVMENKTNGNNYQIKATTYSHEPNSENCVSKRVESTITEGVLPDVDISQLSWVGPNGAFEQPLLDRLVIRMFARIDGEQVELSPGFSRIDGILYGFTWNVEEYDGTYILKADTKGGAGIFAIEDASETVIESADCVIMVYKPNLFHRYSEFDLDIGKMTIDEMDLDVDAPVNSRAVFNYYDENTETSVLHVRNGLTVGTDEDPGTAVLTGMTTLKGDAVISPVLEMPAPGEAYTGRDDQIVNKKYVDDHRREVITKDYPVHGIKQGHENGFDADTVDGLHKGVWKQHGDVDVLPYLQSDGVTSLGSEIQLATTATSSKVHMKAVDANSIAFGKATSGSFSIGIGNELTRYITNNKGMLEFTDGPSSGAFSEIKAGKYTTASSREYKENITPFNPGSLEEYLTHMNVCFYNYKEDVNKKRQLGLIAEDTDKLIAGEDHKSIDLNALVMILLKNAQQANERISELESRLARLEK